MKSEEPDAWSIIERDLNMLLVLSLFIVLFLFLGFLKVRWLEAAVSEPEATDPARAEEESVQIAFVREGDAVTLRIRDRAYDVASLDADTLGNLSGQTEGKRVEIRLDPLLETRDWFPATYALTRRARSVEFTTR